MRRIQVVPDAAALAATGAEEFARAAAACSGSFRVALSGGATPRALYELLADPAGPFRARVPWERAHVFWSDERCVPLGDKDSNFRTASETLLSRVPVPPANVHRIAGELSDADEAARRYEEDILREFASAAPGAPRFDLILLGMGEDGHTASLFPGTTAVAETKKLVASAWVEEKKSRRVTFTLPLLNAAKNVLFLVAGAGKAETARRVLEEPASRARPAGLVSPAGGKLTWLLDAAAASRLASDGGIR